MDLNLLKTNFCKAVVDALLFNDVSFINVMKFLFALWALQTWLYCHNPGHNIIIEGIINTCSQPVWVIQN